MPGYIYSFILLHVKTKGHGEAVRDDGTITLYILYSYGTTVFYLYLSHNLKCKM